MACLLVFLTLASACVLESQPVNPDNRSLDGGIGGAGGSAGTSGSGGRGGMAGSGGVGGTVSPGAQGTCEVCVSDDDCKDPFHRCVAMSYHDAPYPNADSGFCLQIAFLLSEEPSPLYNCAAPYVTILADHSSLSGGEMDMYCGIREDLSTCPSVRAHVDARACAGIGDAACPDGGFCDWVKVVGAGWEEICTYACDGASECNGPGGEACSQGYCGR